MKTMVTVWLLATPVLVQPAVAQDFEFRRELAAGSRFVLRNIIGDVRIEGTSGRAVEVSATKREGRYGNAEDVDIKTFELNGGVAICVFYPGQYRRDDSDRDRDRARNRADREDRDDRDDSNVRNRSNRGRRDHDDPCSRDGNWGNNNRNDTSVDFVVRLPGGLDVDAKTVSGDLIGQGLRGRLDLGTVSGNLQLSDAEGDVLEAASVSGDVELDRITAREVTAETVSGDVTFVGSINPKGAYDFKTLSGDVIVTLPREPDAQVSAVTFGGRLVSDFPVNMDTRKRRNRFNATWGAGTAQLDLESFSGNVRIRSASSGR